MGDLNDLQVQRQHIDLSAWKRLLPYFRPHAKRFVFLLLMMLISAGVDAIVPMFTSYAVNHFVTPATTKGLGGFTALYAALILMQTATTVLYSRQCMILEMNTGKELKKDCFEHLQKLPVSFYNSISVGYILARVMSDTGRICGTISWGLINSCWSLFYLIGILVSMFILNARLALMVLCVIPVIFAIALSFQPRLLRANRRVRRENSRITSAFNENVNGAKTAKSLVIEDKLTGEFSGITRDMYAASVHAQKLSAVYQPLIAFAGSLAIAVSLYCSGNMVIAGTLDYGVLSAFIAYSISLLDPIQNIARIFTEGLEVQVNLERVITLLNQPCTVSDTPEVEAVFGDAFEPKRQAYPPLHGDIRFDHVWFRYPDAAEDDWVLRDICLDIPAGTTVAIVGETGAGKSTMVNLACRFFEPTRGSILIDGEDYRSRSQHWLHSNLGYVQQTPHLFSGTVRENIRYGRLDASDEEVEAAARMVSADKVAAKLEYGYDTDVGEGGDCLSTGEKQLVSFARAVIADPAIFVLDEATSSIDTETELLIQQAITHVLEGRTSFIIAHRLSTIRSADLILLVEDRRIAEMGTHEQLMALGGRYYRLYTAMMIQDQAEAAGFRLD